MISSASVPPENILLNVNQPLVYIPLITILSILIIVITLFVFNKKLLLSIFTSTTYNGNKSQQANVAETNIILISVFFIVILSVYLIPNFNNLKQIFQQIHSVIYIILYTIFLNVLFVMIPTNKLNRYGFIIMPVTVLIAAFLFYIGFKTNLVDNLNLNYEVVKTVLLFASFIALFTTFYLSDPGGYFQKYAGTKSLLFGFLISIFAFLYMISIVTLPGASMEFGMGQFGSNATVNKSSILLFLLFLCIIGYGMYNYPGGFFNDKSTSTTVIILLLIVSVICTIFTFSKATGSANKQTTNKTIGLFQKSLMYLFGISIVAALLAFVVYYIFNFDTKDKSNYIGLFMNLFIIGITLVMVYKIFLNQTTSATNNIFVSKLKDLLLFIPGLFSLLFQKMRLFYLNESIEMNKDNQSGATTVSLLIILLVTLSGIGYYAYDKLYTKINLQGGKLLVESPISIHKQTSLGNYQKLNERQKKPPVSDTEDDNYNYQYGISCWVFVDSNPPNTSSSYSKYTSLLNYGGKPNILYKANTHTLLVLFGEDVDVDEIDDQTEIIGDNSSVIIYKNDNFLLQKWNNIIVNYTGSTVDVFLNGELVKSVNQVVPKTMKYDTLTAGSSNGIQGGICNVVYFDKPITSPNIYYIYNTVKDKSPPIPDNSLILPN